MSNANKLRNCTVNTIVRIDKPGMNEIILKPGEIARYGDNPDLTYFLNGQKFEVEADWNYVIGGDDSHLTCEKFSAAGDGGFTDPTTYNV